MIRMWNMLFKKKKAGPWGTTQDLGNLPWKTKIRWSQVKEKCEQNKSLRSCVTARPLGLVICFWCCKGSWSKASPAATCLQKIPLWSMQQCPENTNTTRANPSHQSRTPSRLTLLPSDDVQWQTGKFLPRDIFCRRGANELRSNSTALNTQWSQTCTRTEERGRHAGVKNQRWILERRSPL